MTTKLSAFAATVKHGAATLSDKLATVAERTGIVQLNFGPLQTMIYPWQQQAPTSAAPTVEPPKVCSHCGK